MKNQTPRQLAFIVAGLTALLSSIVVLLLSAVGIFKISFWLILLNFVVVFLASYFILLFYLERFLYRKIKLIYKRIADRKSPKKEDREKLDMDKDLIGEVNEQVEEWAEEQAKELDLMKRTEAYRKEFLGNVSHELKTPIFTISGYLETLLDGALDDPIKRRDYVFKANKGIDRLNRIVQDLETISELEGDRLILDVTTFDIKELTEEVFEEIEHIADMRDVLLEIKKGTDGKFMVKGDRDKIRQVLINLLTNSIKYGKDGGRTGVGFYDMASNILIEVADNGLGIAESDLPRLFERFYRVEKSRNRDFGGTGLGLAIVKHIIEAHNQSINVRSLIGEGSTFGFTLEKA